jgi:hypothetical protein
VVDLRRAVRRGQRLRQLLLPGLATWQQVATFVATAVVVGAVVALGWRRWEAAHPGDP